ncbi:hypothetical protein PN462_02110 [Spirulina sp. CS-785/01]|uniref:hypothetical protein n=1 Tax=Spirulina sp. CS-785/01 TaxID=3021716 RepID=UPI00232B3F93|nr:hypothetical protein [Spirulina sp. CS-785/01]MDB9311880.1 hypothetical protein [Spirulina sp. CS-785/01]
MRVLNPNRAYTFSQIFELKAEVDDIVADLGYSFSRKRLDLPQYTGELDRLQELQDRLEEILPFVNLTTETARREILIARVVTELVHYTQAQLRIEYPLKVSEQLQGVLDYLLTTQQSLLVIEAKREDLTNGFTQLAVELIALAQWTEYQQSVLYGAVTTGNIWQFGRLYPEQKLIEQGLNLFRVPDDLEPLLRVLVKSLLD